MNLDDMSFEEYRGRVLAIVPDMPGWMIEYMYANGVPLTEEAITDARDDLDDMRADDYYDAERSTEQNLAFPGDAPPYQHEDPRDWGLSPRS